MYINSILRSGENLIGVSILNQFFFGIRLFSPFVLILLFRVLWDDLIESVSIVGVLSLCIGFYRVSISLFRLLGFICFFVRVTLRFQLSLLIWSQEIEKIYM